ncbi:MAG: TonB-dependent receptor [Bacteroidota bacterium]
MRKLLAALIYFIAQIVSAQTEQGSIELPDFVITGRQSVDVLNAAKKQPELVSTLSKDFFVPQYSPEELPLLIQSESLPVKPSLYSDDFYNGYLGVGLGTHTFPEGNFKLAGTIGHYLFALNMWGSNIKDYTAYSDINNSGVSLSNDFFINSKSDLFAGSKLNITGKYEKKAFYFFGSVNPMYARKTEFGSGGFSFRNDYSTLFKYGIELNAQFFTLSDINLRETNLHVIPNFEFRIGRMKFGTDGLYWKQLLKNNVSNIDDYDYYYIGPYMKIEPINTISLKIGAVYASNSNNTFFAPQAFLQFMLSDALTLYAEYKPHTEFNTIYNFVNNNFYAMNGLVDNLFEEINFDLSSTIKYDLGNYFSASVTGEFLKADNYLYYDDTIQQGFFDVKGANDIDKLKFSCDLLFNGGPNGYLIGKGVYQSVKFSNGNFIPYEPKFNVSLSYGYDFSFGLSLKAGYEFINGSFADVANSVELDAYHNISAAVAYKLFNSLSVKADFQNILNRSNFTLKNYEGKPFDIIVGIDYRW